jgi:hypothetical protein
MGIFYVGVTPLLSISFNLPFLLRRILLLFQDHSFEELVSPKTRSKMKYGL